VFVFGISERVDSSSCFCFFFSVEMHFCAEDWQQVKRLRSVLFCPEGRDSRVLRNVCTCFTVYTESNLRRPKAFLFGPCENVGSRKQGQPNTRMV
jgi:hypothetical protein